MYRTSMDALFKGNNHKKTTLITWMPSWACFLSLKVAKILFAFQILFMG